MSFRPAIPLEALWPGEMLGIELGGVKVLLVNIDGSVRAYENRCAHQAVELSRGRLEGRLLTCWAHQWCYDASTGRGMNPRGVSLRSFPVKVEDGHISVDVNDARDS